MCSIKNADTSVPGNIWNNNSAPLFYCNLVPCKWNVLVVMQTNNNRRSLNMYVAVFEIRLVL